MKTVNRLYYFMFFITLFGCEDKTFQNNQCSEIIDYTTDSVYYKIDVVGDEDKESFLVTKEIVVADSSFGRYIYKNWQEAWVYSKTIEHAPNFLYKIYFYKNGNYEEFSKLIFRTDGITYPILKHGQLDNLNTVSTKNLESEGSQYLKIMEISDHNLIVKSINLIYKNKTWQVFSKEIISADGYFLDTTKINFNIDMIYFDAIFIDDI